MFTDEIQGALEDVNRAKAKLHALLEKAIAADKPKLLKKPNGRLTDAGIGKLRALVEAGKTPSEIAREMGITVPAVLNQTSKYWNEKVIPNIDLPQP